ncbi:uncharacterized protein TRIADDRAFT_54049 [Trichoplax adhaerens]|uniref:Uncharacterized protein n=1 Tax=Trichoplax adhaerens TaxID=10228 RepID=B3RQY9_TRIAD|nr:hypothetical protein TRIADDRAFT_54049 [Trichoplax adhaerens]EDV26786.1 hypothetical protein TRIADDRAFT_54049 [Trichoplax adhaerens]|eukprot:XP_002110782.1 hypothetical protein TRIADDRAFT_54049 [Trichoplax adhaerens]
MATPSQRPRRNPPPATATKPQPIRATQSFTLINHGSPVKHQQQQQQNFQHPTRHMSPTTPPSPTANENLKSFYHLRRSESSPDYKTSIEIGNLPLFYQGRGTPSPVAIHRTGSLDTIAEPYLAGHWPPEGFFNEDIVCHKATQTGDIDGEPKRRCARSASWGSADTLKLVLRQQRQRIKQKSSSAVLSPIFLMYNFQRPYWPVSKCLAKCIRQSMESLNQEIQTLNFDQAEECCDIFDINEVVEIPDGHKAPMPIFSAVTVPASTKNADTQTYDDFAIDVANSPSPISYKLSSFAREPPDGVEKIITVVEGHNRKGVPAILCPDKSKVNINFSPTSPFYSTHTNELLDGVDKWKIVVDN